MDGEEFRVLERGMLGLHGSHQQIEARLMEIRLSTRAHERTLEEIRHELRELSAAGKRW